MTVGFIEKEECLKKINNNWKIIYSPSQNDTNDSVYRTINPLEWPELTPGTNIWYVSKRSYDYILTGTVVSSQSTHFILNNDLVELFKDIYKIYIKIKEINMELIDEKWAIVDNGSVTIDNAGNKVLQKYRCVDQKKWSDIEIGTTIWCTFHNSDNIEKIIIHNNDDDSLYDTIKVYLKKDIKEIYTKTVDLIEYHSTSDDVDSLRKEVNDLRLEVKKIKALMSNTKINAMAA